MKYTYTAVFTPSEDKSKYYARIPDLPGCITSGKDLEDAIVMITDAASGWLVVAEDEDFDISPATPQNQVEHSSNDILSLVQIDTIDYRALTDTRAVRKNVSLPAWMVKQADRRGINCSQLLQKALLHEFNLA